MDKDNGKFLTDDADKRTFRNHSLHHCPHIFQKSSSYLKILGARTVTQFHTEDPPTLQATVENLIAMAMFPRMCSPLAYAIIRPYYSECYMPLT